MNDPNKSYTITSVPNLKLSLYNYHTSHSILLGLVVPATTVVLVVVLMVMVVTIMVVVITAIPPRIEVDTITGCRRRAVRGESGPWTLCTSSASTASLGIN
jgi:hypothetical protein